MHKFAASFAATLLAGAAVPALAGTVSSPDGRIVVALETDNDGVPFYTVARDGKPLIAKSTMGFNFTDADPLRRNLQIVSEETASADTRWEQPWGERQWVTDRHNELAVTLAEKDDTPRRITVRLRAFDDGVGFRYEFPEQQEMPIARIADELTEFNIAEDGEAWWIPAGDWNRYEYLYSNTPISAISTAHTPATMKLPDGTHLSFHEAALVDYSGMWLRRMDGTRFRSQLAPSSRGAKVVREGAFTTPWRTIRIADDAAGLVENDLELNLNEPNKLGDVSWFEPAKYIGIWWGMIRGDWTWAQGPNHGATTERARQYIDFAAEHGFRGVLIEGWNWGWDGNWFGNGRDYSFTRPYPDFDLKEVTDYARSKGVHLVGHHETGGNIQVYEAQLEDAMKMNASLGIDVVKTGYVADAGGIISCNADLADPCGAEVFEWHDGQRQVQHHLKVIETAAKYRVAINPHEPVKDTGLRRTYPNWVAREGARGMEYNAWGAFNNPPDHEPTLVYTRMLSGPMDFTPACSGWSAGAACRSPRPRPSSSASTWRSTRRSRWPPTSSRAWPPIRASWNSSSRCPRTGPKATSSPAKWAITRSSRGRTATARTGMSAASTMPPRARSISPSISSSRAKPTRRRSTRTAKARRTRQRPATGSPTKPAPSARATA